MYIIIQYYIFNIPIGRTKDNGGIERGGGRGVGRGGGGGGGAQLLLTEGKILLIFNKLNYIFISYLL